MKGSSYIKYFSLNEASSPLFFVLCSKSIPVLCSLIRFPLSVSPFGSERIHPSSVFTHQIPSVRLLWIRWIHPSSVFTRQIPCPSPPLDQNESIPVLCSLVRFPVCLPLWIRMNPSQFCVHSSDSFRLSPLDQNSELPFSMTISRLAWVRERWPGYTRLNVSVAFVLVVNVNNCKVLWALERKGTL